MFVNVHFKEEYWVLGNEQAQNTEQKINVVSQNMTFGQNSSYIQTQTTTSHCQWEVLLALEKCTTTKATKTPQMDHCTIWSKGEKLLHYVICWFPLQFRQPFAIQTSDIILPLQNSPNYTGKLWKKNSVAGKFTNIPSTTLISVYSCFDLSWNEIIQLKNLLTARSKIIKPL